MTLSDDNHKGGVDVVKALKILALPSNSKQFRILVQIAIKRPDLLQNRSRKSPKVLFPPYYNIFQHKVLMENFCNASTGQWCSLVHERRGLGRIGSAFMHWVIKQLQTDQTPTKPNIVPNVAPSYKRPVTDNPKNSPATLLTFELKLTVAFSSAQCSHYFQTPPP